MLGQTAKVAPVGLLGTGTSGVEMDHVLRWDSSGSSPAPCTLPLADTFFEIFIFSFWHTDRCTSQKPCYSRSGIQLPCLRRYTLQEAGKGAHVREKEASVQPTDPARLGWGLVNLWAASLEASIPVGDCIFAKLQPANC
jgi:hypothetical protein